MNLEELMAYTPDHRVEVASTVLDLCAEILGMEPIETVCYFDYGIGEGSNGAARTDCDELIIPVDSMTGEGFPDVLPGEAIFLQICHVTAHEARHAFQRRAIFESERIFEDNPELEDRERMNEIREGFEDYSYCLCEEYPLQTLEIDADCFGVLVSCILSGCVMMPTENAKDRITAGLGKLVNYYGDEGIEIIYSESFGENGVGAAVMNRLLKAAGHQIIKA